jgi:hypothetical protein
MIHKANVVIDPVSRAALDRIQDSLESGLASVAPHHRLVGRPVRYRVISGRTCEITFRDVPGIDEAELSAMKHFLGEECFGSVSPQTAETLTVRLVMPLKAS